jgi:HD-like signal output (HDOD) protein
MSIFGGRRDSSPERQEERKPANLTVVDGAWLDGASAGTADPVQARHILGRSISAQRDRALTAPDRMFAGALLEVLQAPNLRLPDFPETAQKLDRQLATLEPNYSQVMRTIEADPNLVGRIWQIARSARFPKAPKSLSMAVSRVGLVEIWRLSVQMALEAIRIPAGSFKDQGEGLRLHGVLVGAVTAALAKERRGPQFLAGLLHDVGALVILAAAARTEPSPETAAHTISQHHAAFGMLVAQAWKLDPSLYLAIGFHHDPDGIGAGATELPRLVAIADIAVSGSIDHRRGRQSFPELAIQKMALGQIDPTRPMVLADRSIDRMERDGMNILGAAL